MSQDTTAVFVVANLEVNDPVGYRNYEKGFFPCSSAMAASC